MKPIVKYQGGKSKELPLIKQLLPSQFSRIIEPFCGGCAVSFGLGYNSILNDINRDLINLYSVVSDDKLYPQLQNRINLIKELEHDSLEVEYYGAREVINQSWDCVDNYQRALSYIIVRQLCFSGMERYNSKGDFNVPFGHYKKFSCNLSPDHHNFLKKKCKIRYGSFEDLFDNLNEDDFVFVDPPYLERLGYTQGDGGINLHKTLFECIQSTKAKWMIIHSDNEFYRTYYQDYDIIEKDFLYSQRFGKDKDHTGASVKHLYIKNYK
jgi:DNA adenine methylase